MFTSRFPRTVSSIPASHPSPPFALTSSSLSIAASFVPSAAEADSSHLDSPSSTTRRRNSALARSHRSVRSSTVSASFAVDVVREPRDDVQPLDRRHHRLFTQRTPRDLERELAHQAGADREREVEGVERLRLEPQVLEHDVALEHRDAEVLGADAVDVLAQELVQHARELALEHDGEHGGMGMMLANRVDFLGPVSAEGWATLRDANVRVRGSGHVSRVGEWVSRRRVPT